jgi:hypothetical protein
VHVFRFVAVGVAKTLSKVFGLATMAFFGRLPSRDDDKVALVGIVSLAWITVVIAVFVPAMAEALIPFAPDDQAATRWIAVALAAVMPLLVGTTVAIMHNNRDRGARHRLKQVVMGYPYTLLIGVVVTAVIVVVPVVKFSYLARRFEVMRVLVMVEPGTYRGALDHLCARLREAGIEVEVGEPNRAVATLFRLLGWVLGRIFHRDVADDMRVLRPASADVDRDHWFEITLHAADMTIVGPQQVASRLQAILADALDERVLYLTWDDGSQALEDRIRRLRQGLDDGDLPTRDETAALAADLAELALGREEWDAVRRLVYRLERDAEAVRADRAPTSDGR